MHMRTDHDEAVAIMFCDHCIVTLSIATYSPVFIDMVSRFAGTHATCATQGHPDYTDHDMAIVASRSRAAYQGLSNVHRRTIDLTRA